jgi:hypothetical protein
MFSYDSKRQAGITALAREAQMATLSIVRMIHAPTALVFKTVADPTHFAQAISGVTKIEFLSSTRCGLGTRFRQSRVVNGREMTLDFDVTDYAENERVRIVNEIHGTRWDSVITLTPSNGSTELVMRMDTTTRPFVPRLIMPLMLRLFIRKAVGKDFDAVKAFCEKESTP